MFIRYKKTDGRAITPTRGSQDAAGIDIYACLDSDENEAHIQPNSTVSIGTGIAVEIPTGYFGAIYARSGLATKQGLRPANCVGVIDSDYRGEVKVALHNDSDEVRVVKTGDRIAQLVIQSYRDIELVETDTLTETKRGNGGFGSTGIR